MARYNNIDRIGVNVVESLVLEELNWIFREQPIVDMGIDAHVELVVDGDPKGRLIALQIKTGLGNFHETDAEYVYYGKLEHLDYWTRHSLSVVLIAHIPDTGTTCWVEVSKNNATKTSKNWKIGIPKTQKLDASAKAALTKLFNGTSRDQALRELAIHEPLMRHVAAGSKVSVELEDWINKSLGRTSVEVFIDDEPANESAEGLAWQVWYTGYDTKGIAERLFPWAEARVDEDFYEANNEFELSEHDVLMRAVEEDNGIGPEFSEPGLVYPYSSNSGEVDVYRLELRLNEVGQAWLVIADYVAERRDNA